ncbi:3-dehydroshikimate dehydratase [Xylariales sp. PMI_506]|nr:3-dehydroshikimate dehydratase [Xylariales sp. PMI_506]
MPINYGETPIPISFATCSIGYNDTHTLPMKLEAIANAGYDAFELSMPDVIAYGKLLFDKDLDKSDYDELVEVAKHIKTLAAEHNLKILMLQPFNNFEGWPKGSKEREDAFTRAKGYMRIMEAAGTDMLQIGSTDELNISPSFDDMASDLAELADIFAEKGFKIAYENWCWAKLAPTWKEVWQIVEKANRPNIGLCFDTFMEPGRQWADPRTESGLQDMSREALDAKWKQSMAELAATVPGDKIFVLQISDAYKLKAPLEDKVNEQGQPPILQWCLVHRGIPYDGGYLPVQDVVDAVLATGFRGWFSMEVFNAKGHEKYYPKLGDYAEKGVVSLNKLLHN